MALLPILTTCVMASGRDSSKFRISGLYFQRGFHYSLGNATYEPLQNLMPLAEGSNLMDRILENPENKALLAYSSDWGRIHQLGISFSLPGRSNPIINAGLSFGGAYRINSLFNQVKVLKTDTVFQGSGYSLMDSVDYSESKFNYTANVLMTDWSICWHTGGKGKFGMSAGIGLFAGTSLSAMTLIAYKKKSYTKNRRDNSIYRGSNEFDSIINGSFRNSSMFYGGLFFPISVSYRLSNKQEVLKQLHLYAEIRMNIRYSKIPGLSSPSETATFARISVGLRYKIRE